VETAEQFEFLGATAVIASPVMRELYVLVRRVAQSPASVLVTGESGTGKELVARAIHHYSLRCAKPWIDLSCASLPEHLIESELFGYEKGAFSGAQSPKPGLFEMAHTGTIFLDEIGELEMRMQVKLLRVLDNVPYFRLGGTRKIATDVRVVAATNRDLRVEVEEGRFRADLYHRLTQMELRVPPLRERREDVEPLARYFLAQQGRPLDLAPCAVRALERHSWPGNLRELRNVITRAAILAPGGAIESQDLQLPATGAAALGGTSIPRRVSMDVTGELPLALDAMERIKIFEVLKHTGGHQQRAANLLGISRRTLSRKLKAYETESIEQPV
jgi:DNA-binding NtrC family response regulator